MKKEEILSNFDKRLDGLIGTEGPLHSELKPDLVRILREVLGIGERVTNKKYDVSDLEVNQMRFFSPKNGNSLHGCIKRYAKIEGKTFIVRCCPDKKYMVLRVH